LEKKKNRAPNNLEYDQAKVYPLEAVYLRCVAKGAWLLEGGEHRTIWNMIKHRYTHWRPYSSAGIWLAPFSIVTVYTIGGMLW
jgi:hypothetical protein